MPQYILKRLGLALLTLVLLSLIIFFAGSVLPGNPGRAILGPFASEQAVVALNHQLGVDRPLITQYWSWVSGIAHGDLGTSNQFRQPVSSFAVPRPRALAQAGPGGLRDRGSAQHPRRRAGRAQPRPGGGPEHQHDGPLPHVRAGVRLRDRAHRHLRDRAEMAPRHREPSARDLPAGPAPLPDPARHPPGVRPVRLHRPDGPGGHDRGPRLRLRPHGRPQGACHAR